MISINEFSSRELQKMDIHQLRLLARQVGVNSPTSKNKSDLIDAIVSIITGKSVPELKNINRGRPAKQSEVKYNVNTNNYNPIFAIKEFENDYMVASPASDYSLNKRNAVVHGVVTKLDNGVYLKKFKFADTLDDAMLDESTIRLYGLKENDVVAYVKSGGVVNIYSINGAPASASGTVEIADKKVVLGKKNVLFVSSITQRRELLLGLENFGQVVYTPSNNIPVVTARNITCMPLAVNTDEEIINNFISSCDVAQFFKKNSGNTIFIADNFLAVISSIKQFEYQKAMQLEQDIFGKIDALIKNGITFVGVIPTALKSLFTNLSTSFDNLD